MADNTVNNKQIAKNTFYLYFRSIFILLINLYTSRVILKVLGVDDFGIYNVVGGVVAMFSILGSTMREASQRFITFALGGNDRENIRKVFSTSCTTHLLLAVIVAVLIEIIGVWALYHGLNIPEERVHAAFWVMQFSIMGLFVNIISVPYNALITAHEKMNAFAYISILEGLLKLGSVFLLICFNWDKLILYSILQFLIGVLIRFIYTCYCKKHFEEATKIQYGIDKPLFKEMFAFAGWNLFGSGSLVLRNQGIDILLNLFYGVTVNAAKGVSNQVQHAVHTLVGNFTTSIKPQLIKSIAQKDFLRAKSLIYHGTRISFFLMMFFSVPLMVCAYEVLDIWLVEVPEYAVQMVKLSFIYLLMDSLSRFLISGLLAYGDIRNYQLCIGVLKLLTFPLAWVILKCGGSPLTGIWANIIIELLSMGGRLLFATKRLQINIRKFLINVVCKCWSVWAVAIIAPLLLYHYLTTNIIVNGFISIFSVMTVVWLIGLDKQEKSFAKGYITKILKRK